MKIFINNKMYIQKRDLGILWQKKINVDFDSEKYNITYFSKRKNDNNFILVTDVHIIDILTSSDFLVDYMSIKDLSVEDLESLRRNIELEIVRLSRLSLKENKDIENKIYLLINKVEAIGSVISDKIGDEKIIFPDEIRVYFEKNEKKSALTRIFSKKSKKGLA